MTDYAVDFVVRSAQSLDLERMAILWEETAEVLAKSDPRLRLLPDAREQWLAVATAWLADPAVAVFVVERKETVVGYLVGTVTANLPGFAPARIGMVNELTIDTHGRGNGGLGTHLLVALRAWLAERGISHLMADALTSHAISQAFWRANKATPLHHRMWLKLE